MRNLPTRLIVAVASCALGIGISALWARSWSSSSDGDRRCNCRVNVEPQPDAPIRISVLRVTCPNPYFAEISYKIEKIFSLSDRRIVQYEVRRATVNDEMRSGSRLGGAFDTVEPYDPAFYRHQEKEEGEGFSLNRGIFRSPGAESKLSVWSVTFEDGTVWKRYPASAVNTWAKPN